MLSVLKTEKRRIVQCIYFLGTTKKINLSQYTCIDKIYRFIAENKFDPLVFNNDTFLEALKMDNKAGKMVSFVPPLIE